MKIKKNILCRDAGMIFIGLTIEDMAEGSSPRLRVSNSRSDNSLGYLFKMRPTLTRESSENEYVICLPDFKINQTAHIEEVDCAGKVLNESSLSVPSAIAPLESKANYLLRHDEAFLVRNAHERFYDQKMRFEMKGLLVSKTRWVLRGEIHVPDPEVTNIELNILNIDGTHFGGPIPLENPSYTTICSADKRPNPTFSFSIDIEPESKGICLVANAPGKPELKSFCVVYEWLLRKLHDDFIRVTKSAGSDLGYEDWFKANRANESTLALQRKIEFPIQPKFSIVVPLYNSPIQPFIEMVESVISQSYENWELILVNSTPENEALKKYVNLFDEKDKRIKVVELKENLGIARNTNAGIEQATGDYVCFLDHDDFVEPDILFEYAKAINENPEIKLLYCDEDVFEEGHLVRAHFKTDFSIDHLRCANYICHMLTVEKEILLQIGMVPLDYDGAQDHALTLKVAELSDQIHHVPKMLYHWRVVDSSVASDPNAKPYASTSGVNAVQHHLDRLGIKAAVEPYKAHPFTYRVRYIPPKETKVSIIIPSHNELTVLRRCIETIRRTKSDIAYEVILVENNSSNPELFEYYEQLSSENSESIEFVTWEGKGFNFSSLVNFGVKHATGNLILLLNNDTEAIHDFWLDEMAGIASRAEVGAVGARLFYPDMTIQHAGLAVVGDGVGKVFQNMPYDSELITSWCYFSYEELMRNVSAVTGACLMVSKNKYEEVGGFDENLSVAFNDVDFCLKLLEAGYINVYTPNASLIHHESYTRNLDAVANQAQTDSALSRKTEFLNELYTFQQKWAEFYAKGDPYHNPNLAKVGIGNQYYKLNGLNVMFA